MGVVPLVLRMGPREHKDRHLVKDKGSAKAQEYTVGGGGEGG